VLKQNECRETGKWSIVKNFKGLLINWQML